MFGKRKYKSAINKLQILGKRYILGISSAEDKIEWVNNFSILEESTDYDYFLHSFKNIYDDYLIKHFPNETERNHQFIERRSNLYHNMLFSLIVEAHYLIDDKNLKAEIERYFSSFNRDFFSLSEIGEKVKEEELLNLTKRINNCISDKTEFEKEWHIRIDNISSFKFDKEVILTSKNLDIKRMYQEE